MGVWRSRSGVGAYTRAFPPILRRHRGRGRARCEVAEDNVRLASLLSRYLAGTDSRLADWLLNRPGEEALIEIEINWLTSWDFTGRMGDIERIALRSPGVRL